MKSRYILICCLILMAGLIGFALLFQELFISYMTHPVLQSHARFIHIAAVTLFFSNAVIGIIWEQRSLASGSKEVIMHTYSTVASLDARLSSPLIILSVLGGLSLSYSTGGIWEVGWLSVSFLLFILSGIFWIVSDIPSQYKIKHLTSCVKQEDSTLPDELLIRLKRRWWISIAGVAPLIVVFILMVYKPEIKAAAHWFR